MNLASSIATLERLVEQRDKYRWWYEIELIAHRNVRDGISLNPIGIPHPDWPYFQTAYAEAQLKKELNP